MEIIWKDVVGYEGLYKVSNIGEVKRIFTKTFTYSKNNTVTINEALIPQNYSSGYFRISLRKNNIETQYSAHRLVAEAFIPNLDNKPFVNHINGVKDDNRLENLEWCTVSENSLHSVRVLGKNSNEKYRKPVLQLSVEGEIIKEFKSIKEVAEFGFNRVMVSKVCNNKAKIHKGYYWSFN